LVDDYRSWNSPLAKDERMKAVRAKRHKFEAEKRSEAVNVARDWPHEIAENSLVHIARTALHTYYQSEDAFVERLQDAGLTSAEGGSMNDFKRHRAESVQQRLLEINREYKLLLSAVSRTYVQPSMKHDRGRFLQMGSYDVVVPFAAAMFAIICCVLGIAGVEPWWHVVPAHSPPNQGIWGLV
jgi:hypothetical protein